MNKKERLRAAKELNPPPIDLILEMLKDWSEIEETDQLEGLPNPNTMD
eukprot:CAMPEP_0168316258 /NCGR_PEP_ID=MMETSP0210-20121227/15101_1 /TAXON_ID=40633 /ORGANISM="Condylostoma magnum, Strain COL2" /LENGTH=47 /DNA_ID= /DNA_START= /DNA_END= /DNA_ORIENTATION=